MHEYVKQITTAGSIYTRERTLFIQSGARLSSSCKTIPSIRHPVTYTCAYFGLYDLSRFQWILIWTGNFSKTVTARPMLERAGPGFEFR